MANQPIYDIYLRNVAIVDHDRRITADQLLVHINKCLIGDNLDVRFELVEKVKVPERCKYQDGVIYIAYCRFERTDRHQDAAQYLNQLVFRGRQLIAKVNDVESGLAQWSTLQFNDEDGNPLYFHGEKVKLLNSINRGLDAKEAEVQELKEQLENERELKAVALNKISKFQDEVYKLNRKLAKKNEEIEELRDLVVSLNLKLGICESNNHSEEPSN